MQFLYYALFAAGIVAVDQLSKYFTVAYIPLYTDISFIPGVLNLTYVQNSGAAFSSFEGQQWLFALIFLFFTGLIGPWLGTLFSSTYGQLLGLLFPPISGTVVASLAGYWSCVIGVKYVSSLTKMAVG